LDSQIIHYAGEFWEYYGITVLTIWDIEARIFFSMIQTIDKQRKENEKEARERKRLENQRRNAR